MKTGKPQWGKEPHTTNDCMEKENSPLPSMGFLIGYCIQVVKPETVYKQQKTNSIGCIYIFVSVSLCVSVCVYVVCLTIIITEKGSYRFKGVGTDWKSDIIAFYLKLCLKIRDLIEH